MKQFKVENPEKVPPLSKDEFLSKNNCSDFYFGVALVDERNVRKCVCYWDFTAKKWCFVGGVGKKDLLEYYIEK